MIAALVRGAGRYRHLSLLALVSILSACGGGGSASYTVTASVGTGGSISPTSATVSEGGTTSFTVIPDSGYSIDTVTGCSGSLSGTSYTTGAVTADCTVTAGFVEVSLPTVSIADASVLEGDSGTAALTFTVSLSGQADGDVDVDYATGDGSATAGDDYTAAGGTLTISAATTSADVTVAVSGDTDFEPNETLTLSLNNVSANAELGIATATGTIANDDAGGLNDTGITACGDYAYDDSGNHDNNLDCAAVGATETADGTDSDGDPVPAGQDAHFGRDTASATNSDADGHAGFSFTKIDSNGNPLAADAASWDCVLDNVTGLMWEVKTDDGGLHDKDWTYTWYNSDNATNGGSGGISNGGSCYDGSNCDTEKYVAQVNGSGGICGDSDWRMPTRKELVSLVDSSIAYPGPTIDTAYYPNTPRSWFWSSSPYARSSDGAWLVGFNNGNVYAGSWYYGTYYVRLVRAGQ